MSNIAGKAYAMNVITPIPWYKTWLNRFIFKVALLLPSTTKGLQTLSLIHYARWVIIPKGKFPHLGSNQPKEELKYSYMFFFSNFNGSWDQYVDSFSMAIPLGLDFFWKMNVRYPKSVPITPFHDYIRHNQIDTLHYYNAYPMAASNDVKSAKNVKKALMDFNAASSKKGPEEFLKDYNALLNKLQHDFGEMRPTPIVSLAAQAVKERYAEAHESCH